MQRDIELLRQLLLDIEKRGATCPVDVLRSDARHDHDDQVRYHLWLLTDAGLLKDTGPTAAGVPCVRLTHAGQEFIELARDEAAWRKALEAVRNATGGVPLAVVRSLLAKRAWRAVVGGRRPGAAAPVRRYRRYIERIEPEAWVETYAARPDELLDDDQSRVVRERVRVSGRQVPGAWEPDLYGDLAAELAVTGNTPASAGLPEHFI